MTSRNNELSTPLKRTRSDYKAGLCLTVALFLGMTVVLVSMELKKKEGP